jgi:hypothetical protein
MSLKSEVWIHKTSLTQPLFFEVAVLSQGSERLLFIEVAVSSQGSERLFCVC